MNSPLLTKAIDMIKLHEGFSPRAYYDTVHRLTIGYGRNLDDNPLSCNEWSVLLPLGINTAQAETLLVNDINYTLSWLQNFSWWNQLSDNRKIALLDMGFNLGQTKFNQFVDMISALQTSNYTEAANQMKQSEWFGEVGQRAQDDIMLMIKG